MFKKLSKLILMLGVLLGLFACSPSTSLENTNSSTTTENLDERRN